MIKSIFICVVLFFITLSSKAEFEMTVNFSPNRGTDFRFYIEGRFTFLTGSELKEKLGKSDIKGRWITSTSIYAVSNENNSIIILEFDKGNCYDDLTYAIFKERFLKYNKYYDCTLMNDLNYCEAGDKFVICFAEYCL